MDIPSKVKELLGKGLTISLATVDREGNPNAAPMQQYWWFSEDTMAIADLFMLATSANVRDTGKACISVWDDETGEAYKLRGQARYVTKGPEYELAKGEVLKNKPTTPKGAVVITFNEVYQAARGPQAGELIVKGQCKEKNTKQEAVNV